MNVKKTSRNSHGIQCQRDMHVTPILNPTRSVIPDIPVENATPTHPPADPTTDLPRIISACTKTLEPEFLDEPHTSKSDNQATSPYSQPSFLWLEPGKLTTKKLEQFASDILPTSVQVQLNQPFGKDSLQHSFYAAKSFYHTLLPLVKSGFLSCRAIKNLEKASFRVRQLQQLRKRYEPLDFRSLQGYQADWDETDTIPK